MAVNVLRQLNKLKLTSMKNDWIGRDSQGIQKTPSAT
jgi:hypothetical protein